MTLSLVRDALAQVTNIPAATPEQHLQVIIFGFPHCDSAAGVAMLHRVMKQAAVAGDVQPANDGVDVSRRSPKQRQ